MEIVPKYQGKELMKRVLQAAIDAEIVDASKAQSDLADLVGQSPQVIHNWVNRGPSAQGLIDIQAATGINAAWALFDFGPKFVGPTVTHGLQSILNIANLLAQFKHPTRKAIFALLADLEQHPEHGEDVAEQIGALMETAKSQLFKANGPRQ